MFETVQKIFDSKFKIHVNTEKVIDVDIFTDQKSFLMLRTVIRYISQKHHFFDNIVRSTNIEFGSEKIHNPNKS